MRCFFAFIFVFGLQGCISTNVVPTGPLFVYKESSNNKVTAYFYQDSMPLVNSCLLVGIDGDYKGCIGYPGFAKLEISPGQKEVSFTPNAPIKISNLEFDWNFESGTEYFFEYKPISQKRESDIEIKTQYNMLLDVSLGWYLVEKNNALVDLEGLRSWQN